MAEEIKFSEFTAADPATLEAAGGIVPSAVAGIGNNKSTWTQIKNWISNPLLALINNMVDKTKSMLQIMAGGLRAVYFSARWFEMDIEDSQPTSNKGALWYGSEDNLPVVNLDYGVTGALLDDVITPAINKTGSVIPKGTVCYVSGSQGNRTVVTLAQAVLTPTTQIAIVVATHDVAVNTVGYFVNRGLVNQLNTSAYTEGQILWVSTTAGQLTGTAPAKPYSQIAVGVVTRVHATIGQIRVFPFPIPRLGQLTDVNATGIVAGQSLRLNSSGVFEPYTPLDTVKRNVTVSVNAGWYRLGYVDMPTGAQYRVFGEMAICGCGCVSSVNFEVTRSPSSNTLEVSKFSSVSCDVVPSFQWQVLGDGTTIRLSFYANFLQSHTAFVLYNIGGTSPLTNAYTHEYMGATKPNNNELVNCLDRVTLTDEPAQDVLPSGSMTQPTAIQRLRDNVKHLLTNVTPKNHTSSTTEYGEGSTSAYGHVKKAQYMTIDGTDVVPSSLMYQNVVQRFHMAAAGAGTAGWLNVCSLTCVGGHTNEPITLTLSRRGADKTCRLTMRFQSTDLLNPYVELANYEGQDYGVYYHKRVEGTYDIYVQKAEPYDRCHITEFKSPYNIKLNSENGTVASVPSGSIAFKRAPSDYSITGRLTSQDWNTFTEVGIYNVANWSGANGPTVNGVQAYKWGFLVVEQSQDTVIQTYYPDRSGMPHYRQSWEGGAFNGWKTSPQIGAGLSPNTAIVYQTHATARSDSNAIYLTY